MEVSRRTRRIATYPANTDGFAAFVSSRRDPAFATTYSENSFNSVMYSVLLLIHLLLSSNQSCIVV